MTSNRTGHAAFRAEDELLFFVRGAPSERAGATEAPFAAAAAPSSPAQRPNVVVTQDIPRGMGTWVPSPSLYSLEAPGDGTLPITMQSVPSRARLPLAFILLVVFFPAPGAALVGSRHDARTAPTGEIGAAPLICSIMSSLEDAANPLH